MFIFLVTVGHQTVMGVVQFFTSKDEKVKSIEQEFDLNVEYSHTDELIASKDGLTYYCLVDIPETPIPILSKFIASKLDTEITTTSCRLAFHGVFLPFQDHDKLKVFKEKEKSFSIDRIVDDYNLIGKDLVKKGGDISKYINLKVQIETSDSKVIQGVIESSFGSSGKFKIALKDKIQQVKNLKIKYKVNIFDKTRKWYQ